MKRNSLKVMAASLGLMLATGLFAGCSKSDGGNTAQTPGNQNAAQGSITASGSTALQPLAQEVAKLFAAKNPGANVDVQGGGSGTGLTNVAAGTVEIGNSDIFAAEKLDAATAQGLVDHKVAVVGFATVVNGNVKVDNLTKQQLIDIFTGKITNWKDVGGDDLKIVIISRPDSSGTKATFKKYALDGNKEASGQALKEDSSGAVANGLRQTAGSISYLASSFLNSEQNKQGLKVLKLDGVEMNKDNITSGKYPIWSYEHMYTKGEAKGVAKAFIDYFNDADAQAAINRLGYIPSTDMKVTREK